MFYSLFLFFLFFIQKERSKGDIRYEILLLGKKQTRRIEYMKKNYLTQLQYPIYILFFFFVNYLKKVQFKKFYNKKTVPHRHSPSPLNHIMYIISFKDNTRKGPDNSELIRYTPKCFHCLSMQKKINSLSCSLTSLSTI